MRGSHKGRVERLRAMPVSSCEFTTSDTAGSMTSNSERADVDERPVEGGHTGDTIEVVDVDALPSADEEQTADAVQLGGADVDEKCPGVATDECGRDERPGDDGKAEASGIKESRGRAEDEAVPNDPDSEIKPADETANEPSNEPRSPCYNPVRVNQLNHQR